MKYDHVKRFADFKGLDLRSSEILRPPGFAREAKNVMHTAQGGMTQRYGHQVRVTQGATDTNHSFGVLGIWGYEATNILQTATSEILGASSITSTDDYAKSHILYRRLVHQAVFTNNHPGLPSTFTISYDTATSQYRGTIVRGGATIIDFGIGDGIVSNITQTMLAAAVSADVCTLTGHGGDRPAAFLEIGSVTAAAAGGTANVTFYTFSEVPRPRFMWPVYSGDVSAAANTINMYYESLATTPSEKFENPLKNGDEVFWVNGGTLPAPFVAATTYYVINATKTTIQLAATAGGAAINITTAGTDPFFLCSTQVNPGATFWNYANELGTEDFRPCSSVQLRNVRYFSSGRVREGTNSVSGYPYRESAALSKYDGQMFYRAGLPIFQPDGAAAGAPAPGVYTDAKGTRARVGITSAQVYYQFQYRAVDKAGNIIDGTLAPERTATGPVAGNLRSWTLSNYAAGQRSIGILSRLGFNSNYAIVGGAATTLSPAATDGYGNAPNMDVGDIGYFWDERQDRFIQREVTAIAAGSISFSSRSLDLDPTSPNFDDGQTPTWNAGTAISANVRIVVWRGITAGTNQAKYLVEEIPANPFHQDYFDDKADAALGATLILPAYNPDLPPANRHLATLNDQLIMFGDDAQDRTIYFEDIETPEGVPRGTHQFDLPKKATGAHQSGQALICGTLDSLHEVSGDLSEFKFRVDKIGNNIGITSHGSMQEAEEGLLFFESRTGPYVLANGRDLMPLGAVKLPDGYTSSRLEPYFIEDYSGSTFAPAFQRASSVIIEDLSWYVLFIPLERSTQHGFSQQNAALGQGSLAFVFDYSRGAWYRWLNVDYSNVCQHDGILHFSTRLTGVSVAASYNDISSWYGHMLTTKGFRNYIDHATATTWDWQPHWEALGQPGILKKFLRCRISSHEGLEASSTTFDLNSFVDYDATAQCNDDTLTFTTQKDKTPKLLSENVRSMMLQFTGSRIYEPMIISAYELEAVAPYRQVFKE